jgi:hypothetical protein
MAEDLKLKENTKKEPWTAKRIATTVVIAVLALLMIGGLSYVIIMYQQDHDDSNVFGYYKGEPIRYEAGSVFYNTVNNSDYMTAYLSGDWSSMYSIWYQAYQGEVVYRALADLANQAGVTSPDELVNRLVIDSGLYASEDGSKTFDEEVYKATAPANRTATYNYLKKIFPYYVVNTDLQTVVVSTAESDFVGSLSENTRSFDYFVVGANAIPDDVALEFDHSGMTLQQDAEGKDIEPTLNEIKAYMLSQDAGKYSAYIDLQALQAQDAAKSDFSKAAEEYGDGVVTLENVTNNIGQSSVVMNGINNSDSKGYLASVLTESLVKELYEAEEGYVASPVKASDGSYVFVKVTSTASDDSWSSLTAQLYPYYAGQFTMNDLASEVMSSPDFEDNFYEKFLQILIGSVE